MPRQRTSGVDNEKQVVRCLALLLAMARSTRGVALRPFAEKRGWPVRALYRDVEALERAGVPVRHEDGRYLVEPSWMPPGAAGVTPAERSALFVARHLAPGLRDTRLGRALDAIQAKLSAPDRQAALELETDDALSVRRFAPIDYGHHRATLEVLERAVTERRVVEVRYRRPNGDETARQIEPGYLHWDGGIEAMYVPSWCRLRGDVRNFAVHRIRDARMTDERFTPRPETRRSELNRAFRLWYRKQLEHVVVRFAPDVAGEIRERRWHPSQELRDTPDGGVVLELDISAPEELARWLLGFAGSAFVEQPLRLRQLLAQRHGDAAAIYTSGPRPPIDRVVAIVEELDSRATAVTSRARRGGAR